MDHYLGLFIFICIRMSVFGLQPTVKEAVLDPRFFFPVPSATPSLPGTRSGLCLRHRRDVTMICPPRQCRPDNNAEEEMRTKHITTITQMDNRPEVFCHPCLSFQAGQGGSDLSTIFDHHLGCCSTSVHVLYDPRPDTNLLPSVIKHHSSICC